MSLSLSSELSEEWATIREPVVEGVTFYCKYLGSTLVDDPKGEVSTAEAIKRIIHNAKQVARKPERVSLHVSLQGIRMSDVLSSQVLLQTSIYKWVGAGHRAVVGAGELQWFLFL